MDTFAALYLKLHKTHHAGGTAYGVDAKKPGNAKRDERANEPAPVGSAVAASLRVRVSPVTIAACTDGYVTICAPCDTGKVVGCFMIMLTSSTYPDIHGWLGKEGCRHGTVAFATCVRPFCLRTETHKRLQSIL